MTVSFRVAALALSLLAATVSAAAETVAEVEGRVERYLDSLRSLEASFRQTGPDGSVREGILHLARPGRLRFEYTDGTPLLLVSNGDLLTFIDYEVGQVTRWPIEDTVLGLLVRNDIDLDETGAVVNRSGDGMVTVSARDPKAPEQGLLTLVFEDGAGGLSLAGWQVIDAQGNVTGVELSGLRRDAVLADDLWSFEDPRRLPSQRRRRAR